MVYCKCSYLHRLRLIGLSSASWDRFFDWIPPHSAINQTDAQNLPSLERWWLAAGGAANSLNMSTCRRIVGVEDCFITPIGFWKGQGILPVHHKDDKLVTLNRILFSDTLRPVELLAFSSTGLAFLAAGALSIFLAAGTPFSELLQSFGWLHFPNEQLVNRWWTGLFIKEFDTALVKLFSFQSSRPR
ncbi:Angiotensin-converting enzyme [Trichinella pseudospiralis]|uniref:Uncharacterized protein n=1 Tax=Trichinella pseudospiralis TaxID=6337 RepID=A0A0V1FJ88_TRIPS|nr:hypothetical protein T4D_5509 [Trichinella pseudospiralis]